MRLATSTSTAMSIWQKASLTITMAISYSRAWTSSNFIERVAETTWSLSYTSWSSYLKRVKCQASSRAKNLKILKNSLNLPNKSGRCKGPGTCASVTQITYTVSKKKSSATSSLTNLTTISCGIYWTNSKIWRSWRRHHHQCIEMNRISCIILQANQILQREKEVGKKMKALIKGSLEILEKKINHDWYMIGINI